jgi:hypothetical protein
MTDNETRAMNKVHAQIGHMLTMANLSMPHDNVT